MYYIEINNNKITSKAQISINIELQENQFEVTEEIYNQLTRLPADFETDEEGNIISVIVPEIPIEEIRELKRAEIKKACNEEILAGFYSSVTGEEHLYGYDYEDQQNWADGLNLINAGVFTETIPVKYKGGTFENYTIEQYKALMIDAMNHKMSKIMRCDQLEAQLDAATTLEEVEAITWN